MSSGSKLWGEETKTRICKNTNYWEINRTKSLGMNWYPHEINLFWYGFNSFSVWMNVFHMGIFSFWYGMNSFTLPYINSGPGFPIVLVGTFNKSKYITAACAWQSEHYFYKQFSVAELAKWRTTLRCWMKLTPDRIWMGTHSSTLTWLKMP